MKLGTLTYGLWYAGLAFQALLAVVLLVKKLYRTFPFFTTYILFNFGSAIVCYSLRNQGITYFYAFWISEVITIVLGFAIVFEIFQHFFSVHSGLRKLASLSFRIALVILISVGIIVAFTRTSAIPSRIVTAVLTLEQAARTIEVGLVMFLFVFFAAFGLHWRQHVFGIAVGVAIFSSVELIVITMHLYFGIGSTPSLSVIQMLAFVTSLLIWTGYLLVPEAVAISELPNREQLEQWNRAVMEFMHQ
jgi:hypothetical protein